MRYTSIAAVLVLCMLQTTHAQEFGGVRYLGQFTPPSGGGYTAGCWGWTDTTSGREYAILGNQCGTAFVEITNVGAMAERDFVPGPCSTWREIGVHENYAYVVTEAGGGTQIIDLSFLPDSVHLVKSFTYSAGGKSTDRAHSIQVRDGYMNLNGCATWSPGGVLIFSLADPENPLYRGEYAGVYIHDSYMKNDTIIGAAIYGTGIVVIDATVKTAPVQLFTIPYSGAGTHNISTTVDGAYILSTDEIGATAKTLKIWNKATHAKVAEYVGSPTAIVHNVFVRDSLAIMSYYTAGMRVVSITDPTNPIEVGGYDTRPGDESTNYDGAWSVYPFFPSGKIIIGDMGQGMYVVEVNVDAPLPPSPFAAYSDYATPTSVELNWTDPSIKADGSPLTDFELHVYRGNTWIADVDSGIETYTDGGRTNHVQYTYSIRAVTATDSSNVAQVTVYAGGHPTPNPPTAFKVADAFGGNLVQWTNPTTQVDGTPLNDLAYVLIYRDGGLFDSVAQSSADTGQVRTWTDTSGTYHTYYIRVRDNEAPVHYSTNTATGSAFGGLFTAYSESFDSSIVRYQVTGGWDTTSYPYNSAPHSLTDSPYLYYAPATTSTLTTPRVVLGPDPILRFNHIAIVAFGDFAFVEISTNNRSTWSTLRVYNMNGHAQWADSTADMGDWELQMFDLHAYEGDSVNIRFRIVSNGSINADGWYVDDIYVGTSQMPAEVGATAATGWNLLSLPTLVPDASVTGLYPGSLTSAYRFNNAYVADDTLDNGAGYWVKFAGGEGLSYDGLAVARDTIDVAAGWNLVGSITTPVGASTIASIPGGIVASPVYGYSTSYQNAATLEPGQGYWLKTSQAGKIILSAFLQDIPAAAVPVVPDDAGAVPPAGAPANGILTFSDAGANSHSLTLAGKIPSGTPASWYELPPVPPAEAFDVRFASGRGFEAFDGAASAAKAIVTQGVRYPLTVSWTIPAGATATWAAGGAVRTLAGTGSLTLEADPGAIAVTFGAPDAEPLPAEFALDQNFPNPFNPSTTIAFRLAQPGTVRLEIFNTLGQKIATIADGAYPAGSHSAVWNTQSSGDVPGGVYHARITVAGPTGETIFRDSRKLLLVR